MTITADDIKALQDNAKATQEIADKYAGDSDAGKVAKGVGSGVLTGIALGTALGTVFPGLGNAVGAAVGAIIGALAGAAAALASIFGKNPHADEQKEFQKAATGLYVKLQAAVDSIPDVKARDAVIHAIAQAMGKPTGGKIQMDWYVVQLHLSNYPGQTTPDGYACHGWAPMPGQPAKAPDDARCTEIFFDGRNIAAAAAGIDAAIQAALAEYVKAHAPPAPPPSQSRAGWIAAGIFGALGAAALAYEAWRKRGSRG